MTAPLRIARGLWWRRWYFSVATGLIFALSLWSFSDNLIWNVGQRSNSDPKFIIHGLFCLAWVLALFGQATWVLNGQLRRHRQFGIAAMAMAAGVTLSTAYVFMVRWKGWDAMPFYIQANRLQLPCFALFVWLAFVNRRRPDRHKRLAYLATLFVLEPMLSRAFDPLDPLLGSLLQGFTDAQVDFAWWIFAITTWNGFFLSLWMYDWRVDGRIHPVTMAGSALFYLIWIIVWLV